MRHISVIKHENTYQVWDMFEKTPVAHFSSETAAAQFAIKLRKAWNQDKEVYARSFDGQLTAIPWAIHFSGQQYGWVIEDSEGRFIASVNTRENAVAIRQAMGAAEPEENEYMVGIFGKFKPNGL